MEKAILIKSKYIDKNNKEVTYDRFLNANIVGSVYSIWSGENKDKPWVAKLNIFGDVWDASKVEFATEELAKAFVAKVVGTNIITAE